MAVDSYLEMFTTLYGWMLYGVIWDVFVGTGLVLLPFVGIVLDNLVENYKQQESEESDGGSLRRMEAEVIIAMLVVILAGAPSVPFQASEVAYTPPADLKGNVPHGTITGATAGYTTYASISFSSRPNTVAVPVWWYGVSQASSGISRAVRAGIPTQKNYRLYMSEMNSMNIDDPVLKQEINNFNRDCFIKARTKYYDEKPTSAAVFALLNTHGTDDTEYFGSRVYLNTGGYYNQYRASSPVKPFPFVPLRDIEWDVANGDIAPAFGRPFCDSWWQGEVGTAGLKSRILTELNWFDDLMALYDNGFADTSIRQDVMIKKLFANDTALATWSPRGYDIAYDNVYEPNKPAGNWIERTAKDGSTFVGTGVMSVLFGAFLDMFLKSSWIIQAVLLMAITGLLPFLIITSRFQLGILMSGAMLLFIVKFWTALWAWAGFMDQSMIMALYPGSGEKTLMTLVNGNLTKEMLLQFTGSMLFIILPMVLSVILGLAGFQAGRFVDGMVGSFTGKMNSASKKSVPKILK